MISPVDYLALKARIKEEMYNIEMLENKLSRGELFPGINTRTYLGLALDDDSVCRVIGSVLHDYYNVLENIFEQVVKIFGETIPSGDRWHKELLKRVTLDIPGVRKALISKKTEIKVDDLRKFRHVFRNIYGVNIDASKEQDVLRNLPDISVSVKEDIRDFIEKMDKLILAN